MSKIVITKKCINDATMTSVMIDYSIDGGDKQVMTLKSSPAFINGYLYGQHLTSLIRAMLTNPDTDAIVKALSTIAREKGKTSPNHSRVMYGLFSNGLNLAYVEYLNLVYSTGLTKTAFSNWRLNTGKSATNNGLICKSIHYDIHKFNIGVTVDISLHDACIADVKKAIGLSGKIAVIKGYQAKTLAMRKAVKPVIKSVKKITKKVKQLA